MIEFVSSSSCYLLVIDLPKSVDNFNSLIFGSKSLSLVKVHQKLNKVQYCTLQYTLLSVYCTCEYLPRVHTAMAGLIIITRTHILSIVRSNIETLLGYDME